MHSELSYIHKKKLSTTADEKILSDWTYSKFSSYQFLLPVTFRFYLTANSHIQVHNRISELTRQSNIREQTYVQ